MAVIDRKFDRKILSCDPGPGHVFFFSIHRARCRDLGKMTAVVIARSNNRDRHSPGSFPKNWEKPVPETYENRMATWPKKFPISRHLY